jgi:hypothetical protein
MTDPGDTDLRSDDPMLPIAEPRNEPGNAMWSWAAGIAAVILITFILAAGWNSTSQTTSKAPPAIISSGATTQAVPLPAPNGQGGSASTTASHTPAPSTTPAAK